ncbi:hypothetical protein [uncultured Brevundimonas sp.]|uniref:hypothetical protein n=1 Tax=uncultured Brevundimonas sp. TaxID=213418 RepID=UPI0025FEDEFB|nr:hypothetical protein [uncultured Brevundimonas sp.]
MAAKDAFEARLAELEAAQAEQQIKAAKIAEDHRLREDTATKNFELILDFVRQNKWIKDRHFEVTTDPLVRTVLFSQRRGRVLIRAHSNLFEASHDTKAHNGWNPSGQVSGASFAEIEESVGQMLASALAG